MHSANARRFKKRFTKQIGNVYFLLWESLDWILILFFTVDKTCTVSLMSANANDFTDSKGSGGEQED